MKIVIGLMISYLYTDLLFIYGFGKVLGIKYSMKTTVLGTLAFWASDCLLKIIPQYLLGVEVTGALNVLMLFTGALYVVLFFGSTIKKKLLAYVLYFFMQACMDLCGLKITNLLTGENLYLDPNSDFTFILIGISAVMLTLGNVLYVWGWKMLEQKQWKISKFQWLCLIMPVSQYMLLHNNALTYTVKGEAIPITMIVACIFSIFADIYLFVILERLNQKEQTEEELRRLQHQNELEQIRYEGLKEKQEDAAKIRHDFQNYVLALKQME